MHRNLSRNGDFTWLKAFADHKRMRSSVANCTINVNCNENRREEPEPKTNARVEDRTFQNGTQYNNSRGEHVLLHAVGIEDDSERMQTFVNLLDDMQPF